MLYILLVFEAEIPQGGSRSEKARNVYAEAQHCIDCFSKNSNLEAVAELPRDCRLVVDLCLPS